MDYDVPLIIGKAELEEFGVRLLVAAGASDDDARQVAVALVWSDAHAKHAHGLVRIPTYVERLQRGLINSPASMRWHRVGPAAIMLDADNAFGHVAGCAGIEKAIEMARETGIGIVAVRHSNHFAAAGYFCAVAAQSNAIGMAFTNAAPRVAAAGGTKAVLGTNPIAFGCPTLSGPPVLFDFATSAISGGSTRSSAHVGNRLPKGAALDASGRPTTDPQEAQRGTLLPAAGAKGFGLALMVEILCGVLTGSAVGEEVGSLFSYEHPIDAGHVFLAIDIARFQPLDQFLDRLQTLLLWVKGSATDLSVRFPGELSGTDAKRREREGIPLPEEAVAPLADLARRLGISCPWE